MMFHKKNTLRDLVTRYSVPDRGDLAFYAVCFGQYDRIRTPKVPKGVPCYLFTNKNIEGLSKKWTVILVDQFDVENVLLQRAFKCLPHIAFPNMRRTIYCDTSFYFFKNIENLLRKEFSGRFSVCFHHSRNDIYQEGVACKLQGKASVEGIDQQLDAYSRAGLPVQHRLYETGVLVRDNVDEDVRNVGEAWIQEIETRSIRDQISLPYVAWRNGLDIDGVKMNLFFNQYLVPMPHSGAAMSVRLKRMLGLIAYRFGLRKADQ